MTRLLNPLKPKEGDIQAAIVRYLGVLIAQGRMAWFARVNGGGAFAVGRGGNPRWLSFYKLHGFGKPCAKGISDIIGQGSDGRFVAIEIKRRGEYPTPEQRLYLARVSGTGGLGIVARSVEDVVEAFR